MRQASASADAKPLPSRRGPTVGRRPLEAEFIRCALRHASASADAKRPFRSAQAFTPIEIGLPRRCAPGVGLRRRKRRTFGRRRPTVGRRPLEAEFIRHTPRQASASADAKGNLPVGAGRPPAEGFHAD
jgi:hypothetical protein